MSERQVTRLQDEGGQLKEAHGKIFGWQLAQRQSLCLEAKVMWAKRTWKDYLTAVLILGGMIALFFLRSNHGH